ncbi:MAG: MoxR family ATPase [Deltaproteobacteria bacterium]|nr:MAG: MoxR family ATPase [Deltaproteobacteria bacterium]
MKRFEGTEDYIVSPELRENVNAAILLGRPLLVKGEPGTGKTLLAHAIAKDLGKRLIVWNIKSTTKAKDGLYVYDAVQRLYDSRFQDKDVSDIKQYIKLGKLGEAFVSEEQVVLLIDEIDKADLEFPNDLLNELEEMSFYIPETGETIVAKHRPIVVITSNNEKELPDAFLRRCIFHYIEFPDEEMMERIVRVHHPDVEERLLREALKKFYWIRSLDGLRKRPSTSELIDWIKVLMVGGIPPEMVKKELPFLGILIKQERDYELVQRHVNLGGRRIPLRERYASIY